MVYRHGEAYLWQEEKKKALDEVKKTTKTRKKEGSQLSKIRLDLQQLGVRRTSLAAATTRINVFHDR